MKLSPYETHKLIRQVFPDAITTGSQDVGEEQVELFAELPVKIDNERYSDWIHNIISMV